jgi:coatomer subunit beta'
MVKRLGDDAVGASMNNVAFLTRFLSGDLNACLEILISTQRIPEAAFFARTYLPSQISRVVQLWKTSLSQVNAKAGQSLADPAQYDNLFPGLVDALKTEQFLDQRRQRVPASAYSAVPSNWDRRPVEEMHLAEQQNQFHHVAPTKNVEEKELNDAPEDEFEEAKESTPVLAAPLASSSQPKNLLDDDVEDFQASHPVVAPTPAVMQPQVQPPPRSNQQQMDPDLELDLENLELDDNVDTSEVNLDDDLLDD